MLISPEVVKNHYDFRDTEGRGVPYVTGCSTALTLQPCVVMSYMSSDRR